MFHSCEWSSQNVGREGLKLKKRLFVLGKTKRESFRYFHELSLKNKPDPERYQNTFKCGVLTFAQFVKALRRTAIHWLELRLRVISAVRITELCVGELGAKTPRHSQTRFSVQITAQIPAVCYVVTNHPQLSTILILLEM